jgi:hypothetical protein
MSIQKRKIMSLCSRRLYGSGGGPRETYSSGGSVSRFGGIVGDVGAEDSVTFSVAAALVVFVVGAVSTVGSAFAVGGTVSVARLVSAVGAVSVGIVFVASVAAVSVVGTVCPGIVCVAVVFSAVVEAIVDILT